MSIFSSVRSRTIRTSRNVVVGIIATTLFLFGCSQNPLSVNDEQSRNIAVTAPAPIHIMQVPPAGWNGNLVVYAHGFTPPIAPVAVPAEASQFAAMAMTSGFAFATTSYPSNGMVIPEALADLVALVAEFKAAYPSTQKVFLIGASMGGLVAAQAAEKYPDVFSGVLAMCGVYGNYSLETGHILSFRTIFDYYFPGVIPGDGYNVPLQTMIDWQTTYVPQVIAALSNPANSANIRQLLSVTKLPVNTADPASVVSAIVKTLSMQIYATEDVKLRLGGKPFGNRFVWYFGSDNDKALNAGVKRFTADPVAVRNASTLFGTTGRLTVPLVSIHNTGDNIVPITQQVLYAAKVVLAGKTALFTAIPVNGYGHCVFTQDQILGAFGLLIAKVTGVTPLLVKPAGSETMCVACK